MPTGARYSFQIVGVSKTPLPGAIPIGLRVNPNLLNERNYTISGLTKNSVGTAVGSVTVRLFNTATNAQEQVTTSDGSGNYSFTVAKTQTFYTVQYLAGSPDTFGSSLNTLAGS